MLSTVFTPRQSQRDSNDCLDRYSSLAQSSFNRKIRAGKSSRMKAGEYHLQSVQLVGFALYSHHTINVEEEDGMGWDGGRTGRADDVE